jgi:hypothetical protein
MTMGEPPPIVDHGVIEEWQRLGMRETQHRHAEEEKENDAKRKIKDREYKFELVRDGVITGFLLLMMVAVLYYAGGIITKQGVPTEAKQFATAIWTAILSGGSGYLFGKRSRRLQ